MFSRWWGLSIRLWLDSMFSLSSRPRLDHGLLQHQEPGPAGAEEADEQDGYQERGQPLHRRHQQRSAGRAVPRHQGVHPQPQRVPEDHQELDQDGGEAGSALQKQPVQQWGADPGGELQVTTVIYRSRVYTRQFRPKPNFAASPSKPCYSFLVCEHVRVHVGWCTNYVCYRWAPVIFI